MVRGVGRAVWLTLPPGLTVSRGTLSSWSMWEKHKQESRYQKGHDCAEHQSSPAMTDSAAVSLWSKGLGVESRSTGAADLVIRRPENRPAKIVIGPVPGAPARRGLRKQGYANQIWYQ